MGKIVSKQIIKEKRLILKRNNNKLPFIKLQITKEYKLKLTYIRVN